MRSIPAMAIECESQLRNASAALERIKILHGTRDPRRSGAEVRNVLCAVSEIQHELRPLARHYQAQVDKLDRKAGR